MRKYKTFEEMIAAAKEAVSASSQESSVYVGCDSRRRKKYGKFHATYATVVIVHKDSKHGGQLFAFTETVPDHGSMRERLMNEVGHAVKAGWELAEVVEQRPFQIHLDINPDPNHKSSCVVREATGWVFGSLGFAPHLKPTSFAASHAADLLAKR